MVTKHVPAKLKSFLADRASRYPTIQRVLVFGSRARGDARERADFDLAVVAPGMNRSTWSRFALEVEDDIPTLCGIDLLLLNDRISRPLRTRIEEEGIVIYERAA
jgi:predicted nucleotidyltransferase